MNIFDFLANLYLGIDKATQTAMQNPRDYSSFSFSNIGDICFIAGVPIFAGFLASYIGYRCDNKCDSKKAIKELFEELKFYMYETNRNIPNIF